MKEYDVSIWTDWNKFYLIVSAETEESALSLSMDHLITSNQIKKDEHLTNERVRLIRRLRTSTVQSVRGTYYPKRTEVE